MGSNNPDAYGGDYIGSGSGTKVKQGVELTGGIFGREFLGGKIQRSFKTHGSGSFDEKVDYEVYVLLPLVKSKKSSDINPLKDANLIKSPNVKNSKVGKQEDFYGISQSHAFGKGT